MIKPETIVVPSGHQGEKKKMISRVAWLIVLLFFLSVNSFSQDSVVEKKEKNWSFNGYVKDMQTLIIHKIDENWNQA